MRNVHVQFHLPLEIEFTDQRVGLLEQRSISAD